jgi:hypothetical protein
MISAEAEHKHLRSASHAPASGLRFLVFPGESHGWFVMLDGVPFERHHFVDKRLAVSYAKDWAAGNRPSALVVLDDLGAATEQWQFN